ncbi:MAG: hypothetical protein OJF49_004768 [Ktedonobacterales bacterium]|jgi:signal transduction histidine kinase|nr:MAG: hypothetical protein OJF49_004768 [Ktedonobacterales bacterium]
MQTLSDIQVLPLDLHATPAAHILVAEADESIAGTLAAILRHDGYDVTVAHSLASALELLHNESFALVLADAQLEAHTQNTTSLASAISTDTMLITLARFSALDRALQALRSGAYAYLVKPVDVEELRLTVRRALEHRRLEGDLGARQRELEDAQDQLRGLDEANQRLLYAQEEHERFVAMVAHEMRGPLNPIINYAQLAKRSTVTQQARDHYMDVIVEHAFRLNRLVDDLQTATRLSTGHFTLKRELCDIAAAVSEEVDNFSATVMERHFLLERPSEPILAEVDRDRIAQAVRNLVDNAVKYSSDGSAVELSVGCDDMNVYIRVRDYGAGIPESEMRRIFEAFTRLNKATEVQGSGLGLFITRGIATAHGGQLTVENGVGSERARGAIFTLVLPLRIPETESQTEPSDVHL